MPGIPSVKKIMSSSCELWVSRLGSANRTALYEGRGGAPGPFRGEQLPGRTNRSICAATGGGEFENVAILVVIAVNEGGYREVLGAAERVKKDKASWVGFFQWLRSCGLAGVKLIVSDKCLGTLESVGEVFSKTKYQRCTVHFYRNMFSVAPRSKVKLVFKMFKAIHAQESKKAARKKPKPW